MKKHPELLKKLELLYSLNPASSISSNSGLAKELGISRQNVSRWINGTETSVGNRIPANKIEPIAKLFSICSQWFSLPYPEFEIKVIEQYEHQDNEVVLESTKTSLSLLPITQSEIFGRDKELSILNAAWQDDTQNLLQIIAFGGVGKSSLVNHWLSKLHKEKYPDAKRVYAWSFYWQGEASDTNTSGDLFIKSALEWFGDTSPTLGTPWAKATRLAHLIRSSKTLLILDGLEPLQYIPGPKSGQVENPAVALLIRELASNNTGLCLITSRLPVADLSSYDDGRVQTLSLDHLTYESSVKLLKNMGIYGQEFYFDKAVNKYQGHPLSLLLLGGYLSVAYKHDISKFSELDSLLEDQDLGSQAKNLMKVYLDWFEGTPELNIIYLVCMLDRSVTLSTLKTLSTMARDSEYFQNLRELSNLHWKFSLGKLSEARLLTIAEGDVDLNIDCHPLIRDFVENLLEMERPDIRIYGHDLIFKHLVSLADASEKKSRMDLLFRAVVHGTKANLFSESFGLYSEKIKNMQYSMFTEGSQHSDQVCIRSFFDSDWNLLTSDLSEESEFYLLSISAINLMNLGLLDEAIEPAYKSLAWHRKRGKWAEAATMAGHLTSMLIVAGKLSEVEALLNETADCVRNSNNFVISSGAKSFRGYYNFLIGDVAAAATCFEEANKVLSDNLPTPIVSFPTLNSYYVSFLIGTGEYKLALQSALQTYQSRSLDTWQSTGDATSIFASDIMVLGLAYLACGGTKQAEEHLNRQVELFKSSDEWLYLPTGLNSRAIYYMSIRKYDLALKDLEEALDISNRTRAKLGEWDTYINLANLHAAQGQFERSSHFFEIAISMPEMRIYKFRDTEIENLRETLDKMIPSKTIQQRG
jgi:tetratricopeptide (TPR) repeat protein